MNGDEALLFFFLIEHIGFATVAFGLFLARLHTSRRAKQEETSAALQAAQGENQIADVRTEMAQMREMMAELLLDMHARGDALDARDHAAEGPAAGQHETTARDTRVAR